MSQQACTRVQGNMTDSSSLQPALTGPVYGIHEGFGKSNVQPVDYNDTRINGPDPV